MNINERERLKKHIEADLYLLIEESWDCYVREKLKEALDKLEEINLEGYDK
jgi:hypothetical protein